MRIAFVTARAPFPCDSGGRIRTYNLLRHVATAHDVTVMTAVETAADVAALEALRARIPSLAVKAVHVPRRTSPSQIAMRLMRLAADRLPYTWRAYSHTRFAQDLRTWMSETPYDVVHCDHVQIADMLLRIPSPPRLLNAHNVESVLARRMAERYGGARGVAIAWQARKIRRAERACFQGFDHAVAVSELDASRIADMAPGLPTSVVPNGVDTDAFAPSSMPPQRGAIVFTGAMDWRPNIDGVSWFVRHVLPRIRAQFADVVFTIVGRKPSRRTVSALTGDGVRFTGTVDDVRPFMERASLVIVPLLAAGGTRLKILEAWSMGKAVVSTSIGAEGLPAQHGRTLMIGDTPQEFAEHANRVLCDASLQRRLGSEARVTVEETFAWPVVAKALLRAYEDTALARSRHAIPAPVSTGGVSHGI